MKPLITTALVLSLASPLYGQTSVKTNPYNQKLLTGNSINGVEYKIGDNQGIRIGWSHGKGVVYYLSGSTDGEFDTNFYRNQLGLEMNFSKRGIEPAFAYTKADITTRVLRDAASRQPRLDFTYLNVNGQKVRKFRLYPYANVSIGREKIARFGLLAERAGLVPYYFSEKSVNPGHHLGLEYHKNRCMVAVRSKIGKESTVGLYLRWKFRK